MATETLEGMATISADGISLESADVPYVHQGRFVGLLLEYVQVANNGSHQP